MAFIPFLLNDNIERLSNPVPINFLGVTPINQAFTDVAQEVAGLLKQPRSFQTDSINRAEMVMIRAIEPEYKRLITVEPLTARELEVLQLIVEGDRNSVIAQKLYITEGTVKTHVRNVLKKLCVSDRTQAAIRALRSGLVH